MISGAIGETTHTGTYAHCSGMEPLALNTFNGNGYTVLMLKEYSVGLYFGVKLDYISNQSPKRYIYMKCYVS
jgi:hypothetical protein